MADHVLIPCPATGQVVETGVEMDRGTFEQKAQRPSEFGARLRCTACGQIHEWYWRDTLLALPES
jgi:hypothetical protein